MINAITPSNHMRGILLFTARGLWLFVVALALGLYIARVPINLRTVVSDW